MDFVFIKYISINRLVQLNGLYEKGRLFIIQHIALPYFLFWPNYVF